MRCMNDEIIIGFPEGYEAIKEATAAAYGEAIDI